MSTKYDIPSIRAQVIKHLQRYYPVHACATFEASDVNLLDEEAPDDYDFQLLAVAQQCNVRRILPMLYYKCASNPLPTIFKSSDNLDKETLQKILIGREKLLKLSYDFGILMLFPGEDCANAACFRMRRQMISTWTKIYARNNDDRQLPIDAISQGLLVMADRDVAVCSQCFQKSARARSTFKYQFWDELPSIFGLGSWYEVMVGE